MSVFNEDLYKGSLKSIEGGGLGFEIQAMSEFLKLHSSRVRSPHIQDFYQILWFKSGTGKHSVDFHQYDVFENALFFIGKNQVQCFDDYPDYDGFVISFDEEYMVLRENEVDFSLKSSFFNNPYQRPSVCVGSGWEYKLDEYISQMRIEIAESRGYGKEDLLRFYIRAFLIQVQRRKNELEEASEHYAPYVVDEKRRQLIRFVNLVEEKYALHLQTREYADLLNISPRTLSGLTLSLLGKAPSQMIQERIILEAKRLLLYSDCQVKQIADKLGFEDPAYFVRYFRKHLALSPMEFRMNFQYVQLIFIFVQLMILFT